MQNSFPYIDILIFGVIAIFLIFRLKNILGTKTGFEETDIAQKAQEKQYTNIIPLKSNQDNAVISELNKILKANPDFNIEEFLSGSKTFFEMVLNSFVSGNLDSIKDYTKLSVLKSFKAAIDERNKEQEKLIIELKSIKKNKIIKSTINRSSIKINVEFESFQVRALIDKNNEIIDGDNEKEILVKDEWVFEKKINDDNPDWTLIETKSN